MSTSSKAWEDFNVHNAFNKALKTAYMNKYEDDEEDDDWNDDEFKAKYEKKTKSLGFQWRLQGR